MSKKILKNPGPDHPMTIEENPDRVVVTVGGRIIADTISALTLREADYPPVEYIPREDIDMEAVVRSDTVSYCPYKGDASYFSIPAGGPRSIDAAWCYETPHPAAAKIANHLAFYRDRVDLPG